VKPSLGADLVIPALALAFAAYFFVSIADLAWEAKANGVIIGSVLVTLIVVQLARIVARLMRREGSLGMESLWHPREALVKRLGMVAISVAFIDTLQWLGLTLGLALSLFAALWIMGVRQRYALILVPLLVSMAAYGLFIAALQTDIPHGPIERLLS
jgi:hypothetical protein